MDTYAVCLEGSDGAIHWFFMGPREYASLGDATHEIFMPNAEDRRDTIVDLVDVSSDERITNTYLAPTGTYIREDDE